MIDHSKSVFFIGIKGVAMTNLALILKKIGKRVAGSDLEEEFITDQVLRKNNIPVSFGFHPRNLPSDIDLVVYSAAHQGAKNPQIITAQKRGIRVASQATVLADLFSHFQNKIAVCGAHGKTTTASFLAYSLTNLKQNPSYLVGAPHFNNSFGGNLGSRSYFILEADEYAVDPPRDMTPKFHHFSPDYILASNVEFDHPDVYRSLEGVKKSYLTFFKKLIKKKSLFACLDSPPLAVLLRRLPRSRYETYGFSADSDLVITGYVPFETGSTFSLGYKEKALGTFSISLFGKQNVANAAGVVLTLLNLGFNHEQIKKAIIRFGGAKRRFEKVSYLNGVYLFDDYAHHPSEIEATIQAARARFPKKRILIVFQPHTYSRTASYLEEFVKTLSLADFAFILPIFASAREKSSDFSIRSSSLQKRASMLQINNLKAIERNRLFDSIKATLERGDVIFTMGAGDVYKAKGDIIKAIRSL